MEVIFEKTTFIGEDALDALDLIRKENLNYSLSDNLKHVNNNALNNLIEDENFEDEKTDDLITDDPIKRIKVFISQPMKDKTNEEILKDRRKIEFLVKKELSKELRFNINNIIFIDSFQKDKKGKPLYLLGESLKMLSEADVAFFPGNYQEYRGCNIEYKCAKEYGMKVRIYNL